MTVLTNSFSSHNVTVQAGSDALLPALAENADRIPIALLSVRPNDTKPYAPLTDLAAHVAPDRSDRRRHRVTAVRNDYRIEIPFVAAYPTELEYILKRRSSDPICTPQERREKTEIGSGDIRRRSFDLDSGWPCSRPFSSLLPSPRRIQLLRNRALRSTTGVPSPPPATTPLHDNRHQSRSQTTVGAIDHSYRTRQHEVPRRGIKWAKPSWRGAMDARPARS